MQQTQTDLLQVAHLQAAGSALRRGWPTGTQHTSPKSAFQCFLLNNHGSATTEGRRIVSRVTEYHKCWNKHGNQVNRSTYPDPRWHLSQSWHTARPETKQESVCENTHVNQNLLSSDLPDESLFSCTLNNCSCLVSLWINLLLASILSVVH